MIMELIKEGIDLISESRPHQRNRDLKPAYQQ